MRKLARRWAWILGAAAAISIAVYLVAHLRGGSEKSPAAASKASSGSPPTAGSSGAPREPNPSDPASIPYAARQYPATPVAPAQLPPTFDRLKSAADAGDRGAACRLGIELLRCAEAPTLAGTTTRGPSVAQSACEAVPADGQAASRYLSQAAAAGSDAARRALAGDRRVGPSDCGA